MKLFILGLATLFLAVPPITEAAPILGAITGAACIAAMAVCVFKGGLTDVSGE